MDVVNCPHCGTAVKINSTSLSIPCTKCGKAFNPKYPEGAPVKGHTKYEVAGKPEGKGSGALPFMKKPAVRVAFGVLAVVALAMFILRFTQVWVILTDSEPEGPEGWHRYRDDDAGFTVWFPATPDVDKETVGMLGLPPMHIAACETGDAKLELEWSRTVPSLRTKPQEIAEVGVYFAGGQLHTQKQIEHQGINASFAAGTLSEGEVLVLVLETQENLFVLTLVGNSADWDKFVDCFHLDRDRRAPRE